MSKCKRHVGTTQDLFENDIIIYLPTYKQANAEFKILKV